MADLLDPTDDPDDAIEIELRPPAEVADRLIALAAVGRRALLERGLPDDDWDDDEDDPDDRPDDAETERFDLVAWLRDEGIWDALTVDERTLLAAPVGSLQPEDVAAASWAGEALVALAWGAGLIDALPPFDGPAEPRAALARVPEPWDKTAAFRRSLRLRSDDAAAAGRERAEVWTWRIGAERLRRVSSGLAARDLAAAVRETAAEARAAGLLESLAAGDFPVGGRPVSAVPAADLDDLEAVAAERLRALNWLCGLGATWDDAPREP